MATVDDTISRAELDRRPGRTRLLNRIGCRAPFADDSTTLSMAPEYLTLQELIAYSGMSRSTLKRFLTDRESPLPRASLPHEKVRVRRSDFDRWIARRRRSGRRPAVGRREQALQAEADAFLRRVFGRLAHSA